MISYIRKIFDYWDPRFFHTLFRMAVECSVRITQPERGIILELVEHW
jgi:hypothetical protein